jgi:hypothetical protein
LGIGEAGPKSSQSSRSPALRSWLSAGAIWQHWKTMQGDGRSSAAIHTSNRDGCVSNVKFGKYPSEGRIIRLLHCPEFPDSQNFSPSLLSRPRIPQNTRLVFSGVQSVEIFHA